MSWDPVTTTNLALCVVILALGIWGYAKRKIEVSLIVGIAFGLFGVSHFVILIGAASSLTALLIAIRLLAYLLVVFALSRLLGKAEPNHPIRHNRPVERTSGARTR